MINDKNLGKVYGDALSKQESTIKELIEYGFNPKDLYNLMKDGTLERNISGYYSFKSIDDLLYLGKKLISMEEYDRGLVCLKKCYELNPNHLEVCFQLFLNSIQNRDYEKAFEYFDYIYDTDNSYYNSDKNYYLYLLSIITELPECHRQYARYLQVDDVKIDLRDEGYDDICHQNNIRALSLNQKFILALNKHNGLIKQKDKLSEQDILIKVLLSQAVEEQNRKKRYIVKLIQEKQYSEVIDFLEKLKERHKLSQSDEYILSLTYDLVEIIKTGIIPNKQVFSTNKLSEAINGKNYGIALSLSARYVKNGNINPNSNAVYLLLIEIKNRTNMQNNVPSSLETKNNETTTPAITVKQQEIQPKATVLSSDCGNTFEDVIKYLMENNLDNAFISLRNYLDSIGKGLYEFLIIDLIKVSILERDIAFTKPMTVLTYVARENFKFNLSEYIQDFYETLAQNNFDVARVYLDIISKSDNLGQSCVLTKALEQVLDNSEKMLSYQRNNEILNNVEQSIQNTKDIPVYVPNKPQYVNQNQIIYNEVIPKQPFIEEITINEDYDDSDFIKQKLDTLHEKGIILLGPMDSNRRKRIHNIVKNIPDVVSFSIGSDSLRQVVLRFKPVIDEYVDIKELSRIGSEAYLNGDYDICISSYRQILQFGEPNSFVYSKLGLAYMKKLDIDIAIDYLTVATELSKNENKVLDYTGLIDQLNGLISKKDAKPYFKMSISKFKDNVNNYYGIEVDQVVDLLSSGMTIDDACLNLGMDDNKKNIVTLIFAREFYVQEDYKMGDLCIKKVEKSKNKSEFVNSLLVEIKKDKKFYKNRAKEGQKRLVLNPKVALYL